MKEKEFYSRIKLRNDWEFSNLSRKETSEITHSYHKYPAKFIPQLAKILIESYTNEGDFIWDSFCGSGTLNVEAFRNKRHTLGTDINSVAVLISRVKTIPLEPNTLNEYKKSLLEAIYTSKIHDKEFYISKGILNGNIDVLKKWFPKSSLSELGHILWRIQQIKSNKKYREFALCAFSSILKKSSYWLNSSIKSQFDPTKNPENPLFYFEKQLKVMEKANELFFIENKKNKTRVLIYEHNAKHRLSQTIKKFDCIITSPPYLVSYDYSAIFRLSTYFLFYQRDYIKFRKSFIGTPLLKNGQCNSALHSIIQPTTNSINDTIIKRTLIEYYKDMGSYFRNTQHHLKKNGQLILVVGDTRLRRIKIPNAYLLTMIANINGWSLDESYMRMIPVKILPSLRDVNTGRFTNKHNNNSFERYNKEYILIFKRKAK